MTCDCPIGVEALAGYWLGEMLPEAEARLEAQYLGCAVCTRRLEEFAGLTGKVSGAVSAGFLDEMKRAGLRVREYRVAPGESVACTIAADDDAVVSRLIAPLEGVRRLDIVQQNEGAGQDARMTDVPFDARSGEVLVVPSAVQLRAMPAFVSSLRPVAVDATGEREIGRYRFHHTSS